MKKGIYQLMVFLLITVINSTETFAQVTANQPSDLQSCDDNNDGIALFDLTITEPEIIGVQDPNNFFVNYYVTLSDANSNMNVIFMPNEFFNTVNPQTIYARIENSTTGEFDVTSFNLFVNSLPVIDIVSDLINVDENGDDFAIFDLTIKIPEILNGQTDVTVTFFETEADATNQINVIVTPESYINSSNPQTIFARLENLNNGCFAVGEFDLVLVDVIIEEEPDDLYINEGDNDGLAIFNLTTNETQMLGDQNPLIALFTYHVSLDDATNGNNSIATPNAYENILNPQIIYVRLTNSNTGSFVLTNFNIETDGNLSVENNLINNLKLYPNPTSGLVTIQSDFLLEKVKLIIYNIQGQVLISKNLSPINSVVEADLTNFLTGVYFVKIIFGDNMVVKRIIKE